MRQFAPLLLVLLSATVAVAAYMQALNYPFISDDANYITENTKLTGLHLAGLWRLFTEPYNAVFEFLPLRDLSYWFDMTLFGMNPPALRLHNILLYLLCLPLLYAATLGLWRYFRPKDSTAPWAAAAVTALFALHPALVESVVWISGRKYILPDLFSLLALWLAVNARRERGLSAPHTTATLVAFAAVMFSKSSYVAVAPVIALLWALFWLDIPKPERCRSLLLWPLAILVLAVLLTMVFIAKNKGFDGMPFYFGIEAITRTLAILGWLARLAVSPESRHFFYPVFEYPHLPIMVALGAAVVVAATTGAVMILRKRSLEGFAWIVFLLLCMPYIQLIPNHPPSLVSDRYLALAVWPSMLLLVALSWRLKPAPRIALLLVIALPWGFHTMERTRDWRSYETLVEADLRAYPGHYLPAFRKITGVQLRNRLYREAGETAGNISVPEIRNVMLGIIQTTHAVRVKAGEAGKPQEAMAFLHDLELLLKQPPAQAKWNSPVLHIWKYCQNILLLQWGHLAEQFPDDASVRYNAGLSLLNFNAYKEATAHLRAATESQRLPEALRSAAFKNLGLALMNSRRIAEAEAPLRAALEQTQPDLQAYCLLSMVYIREGRLEEAARAESGCPAHAPDEKAAQ